MAGGSLWRVESGATVASAAGGLRAFLAQPESSGAKKAGDDGGGFFPLAGFPLELGVAGARQLIELGLAVIFGDAPLGIDVALLL